MKNHTGDAFTKENKGFVQTCGPRLEEIGIMICPKRLITKIRNAFAFLSNFAISLLKEAYHTHIHYT